MGMDPTDRSDGSAASPIGSVMSQLQNDFLAYFKEQGQFTTKEAYLWYCSVKRNPNILPDRNQVFNLIIWPLLHQGKINKIGYGLYVVVSSTVTEDNLEDDEFDQYLKGKLKGGERDGDKNSKGSV